MAKKDPRVQMFIWFVMQDSQGSLWQSGIYRGGGAAKPAQRTFGRAARGLSPVNGKVTVKGGTRNPLVTVYLREYCSNNPVGAIVGYTARSYLANKLVKVDQGAGTLGVDCTVPVRLVGLTVAKKKSYRVDDDDQHRDDRRDPPHDHGRRRVALAVCVGRASARPTPPRGVARRLGRRCPRASSSVAGRRAPRARPSRPA